jgi:hypothetical protein
MTAKEFNLVVSERLIAGLMRRNLFQFVDFLVLSDLGITLILAGQEFSIPTPLCLNSYSLDVSIDLVDRFLDQAGPM